MRKIAIILFIAFLFLLEYASIEVYAMNKKAVCPPDTETRRCGEIRNDKTPKI